MEVNGKEEIMKKNIIVVAAVCLLSAACAKEVQPQAESQGSASGGYIEETTPPLTATPFATLAKTKRALFALP